MALAGPKITRTNKSKTAEAAAAEEQVHKTKAAQAEVETEVEEVEEAPQPELQAASEAASQNALAPAEDPVEAALPQTRVTRNAPIAGFEDIEDDLGFGSFPIVKLDGKDFEIEGEQFDELNVVLLGSRNKYLFKAREGGSDETIPVTYSYDQVTNLSGRELKEIFAEWVEADEMPEGGKPVIMKYKEVQAILRMEGHALDEKMVLLNIPSASRSRFAGYVAELNMKQKHPSQVVTRLSPGKKVGEGKRTFYPWNFTLNTEMAV